MALIDVVKNKVVTATTGVALKKVRGFLEDTIPNTSRNKETAARDGATAANVGTATTGILQFPSGVQSGPGVGNQGHYIMFYIVSTEASGLGAKENVRTSARDMQRAMEDFNLPAEIKEPSSFVKEAVSVVREVSELAGETLVSAATTFSSLIPLGDLQGSASSLRNAISSTQTKLQQGLDKASAELEGGLTALQGEVGKLSERTQTLELGNEIQDRLNAVVEVPGFDKISQATGVVDNGLQCVKQLNTDFDANLQNLNLASRSGDTRGFTIKRPARGITETAIALYMPNEINVRYGADWGSGVEIGALAQTAANVATSVADGESLTEALQGGVDPGLDAVQQTAQKSILSVLGAIPGGGGALEAFELATGEVISDRIELAFKRMDRRTFNYVFSMIPKNREEAQTVRDIVKTFKTNMMAELKGDDASGRRLKYPNTFEIEYMYNGQENQYLHKISECALVSMDVKQGGDRYRTFRDDTGEGPPPVETVISLTFKELEILHKDRVEEGY